MKQVNYILVDGSSYLYRAFYVPQLKRMSNRDGQPTGAVFGTINMIKSLHAEYPDAQIIVVFDAKGKTFRHDLYSEYKANRPPMPDELRSQIDYVHTAIKALGYPLVIVPEVEADDVLAIYAKQAEADGKMTLIASGDKDLAQVVTERIHIIDTMKKVIYDRAGVEQKYGVRPEQIIDYLTLIGDSSDNIPGVPKVGPKTAVKWLQQYQSLSNIIENAEQIKGKVGENLRAFIPDISLSKELVTIKLNFDLPTPLNRLTKQAQDTDTLIELYKELHFNKWLSEMGACVNEEPETRSFSAGNYRIIVSKEEFLHLVEALAKSEGFAFDTETTSLSARQAQLVGLSFSIEYADAVYIPVAHDYEGAPEQLEREWVLAQLKPIFEDSKISKIGQNLKYDINVLKNYGIQVQSADFDTMLQSYVLNSVAHRHDMDTLSQVYLSHRTVSFSDIAGKGKNQLTFNQIALEKAGHYAAEDADITLRLHHELMPKLSHTPSLQKVFHEVEMPLVTVLADMEHHGVLIDDTMLYQQSQYLSERINSIEQAAHALAEEDFNLASPKQIQEVLYEKMDLPVLRKTPKGVPSTAEDVLQELAIEHELPRLILQHRSLGKLKSTYTDKLPMMINARTGRVHTSYHQAVTATGRLSSAEPNLQNIPIRTEEGRRIREAFCAPKDHLILAMDYSQIELRIMAHLSQDTALIEAFNQGLDVHSATASEIFACDISQVNAEQRRYAKAVNFGLIYGMSAFGLAKQLQVPRKQAQEYINQYFERYPAVKAYMENTRESARETGYVETVFGRRLYLPDINAKNHSVRQYAERTAINAPMQGTAADIIKTAMIAVHHTLSHPDSKATMVMQVHDELVFEVHENAVPQVQAQLSDIMQNVVALRVPLVVDVGVGGNWSQAH